MARGERRAAKGGRRLIFAAGAWLCALRRRRAALRGEGRGGGPARAQFEKESYKRRKRDFDDAGANGAAEAVLSRFYARQLCCHSR